MSWLVLLASVAVAQEPGNIFSGTYRVARITTNGETEDYAEKMARAGRALDEDCITKRLVFDFGPDAPEGATQHRPGSVAVHLQQECKRGGLGVYRSELSVEVTATWANVDDGGVTLSTAKVEAASGYTRLREPAEGDMRAPPHWLGPEQNIKRDATTYVVEVDKPRRRRDRPSVRLVDEGTTLHLEPIDGAGPPK